MVDGKLEDCLDPRWVCLAGEPATHDHFDNERRYVERKESHWLDERSRRRLDSRDFACLFMPWDVITLHQLPLRFFRILSSCS